MPSRPAILCALDTIPNGACKGLTLTEAAGEREIFIVRRGDKVFAYVNSCPHTGVTLNWKPDEFLSFDRVYIQCSIHGAQFRISDGYCVYGPCAAQSLQSVSVEIIDGMIVVSPRDSAVRYIP